MFYERNYTNNDGSLFPVNRSSVLDGTGVCDHFFCTRNGGVSRGIYNSLNFSFTRGDDPSDVAGNFKRAAAHLGRNAGDIVSTVQTHTVNIRHVTSSDMGKGVTLPLDYNDIDALITGESGPVLTVYTADCVPVLFADPVSHVIATAHAGWKGTLGGIVRKVINEMCSVYGCRPENIRCAIGPCICGKCYEVDRDLADAFRKEFPEHTENMIWDTVPGKSHIDLRALNRMMLCGENVLPENIDVSGKCTFCDPEEFFSNRYHGVNRGNMCAFITMGN